MGRHQPDLGPIAAAGPFPPWQIGPDLSGGEPRAEGCGLQEMGSTRSASPARMWENQPSSPFAYSGSWRRFNSMPRLISARTITLVPISFTGVAATRRSDGAGDAVPQRDRETFPCCLEAPKRSISFPEVHASSLGVGLDQCLA